VTYLEILNMVRNTANTVNPTGTFIHGRNSDAANAAELPYPRIHLYPFTQDADPLEVEKRTTPLLMSFVELDTGEQDEDEREVIIDNMDTLKDLFIDSLIDVYNVEFSSIKSEPQYQILEGVSGYSLSFTIKSQAGC